MREWKIGDPVGDGNDIGVPDTRYMGYLKDDEYETEKLEDFRFFYGEFHREFESENFDTSFSHLNRAFEIYQKLNIRERQQLSDNPFNHRYAVELYSLIYNLWDERRNDVIKIINKQEIPIVVCDNCKNIYPTHYTYCVNCGESLEKSQNEKILYELLEILQRIVYDKTAINPLIVRSRILMESNDSKLVRIDEVDFLNIYFIFEKEHKYFKTIYTCLFSQEYHEIRIFEDYEVSHDYTRLLNNKTFQKSIQETEKRTGFKFKECNGGYGGKLDENRMDFVFTDEIYIIARFDMGNGHTAVYDIDLDKLKLSRDYRKY